MRRRAFLEGATALGLSGLGGCGEPPPEVPSAPEVPTVAISAPPVVAAAPEPPMVTVRLGAVLSLNGPTAEFGRAIQAAWDLAIDEVNARSSTTRRKVVLTYLDDEGEPVLAESRTQQLIEQRGVTLVMGGVMSPLATAAARVANHWKVPFITPTATRPSVLQTGEWAFRGCLSDLAMGRAAARLVLEQDQKKKVAILMPRGDEYARLLSQGFSDKAGALGAVVPAPVEVGDDVPEIGRQLARMRLQGAEVVFAPGDYRWVTLIAGRINTSDVPGTRLVGADSWAGAIRGPSLAGSRFVVHFLVDDPDARGFVDRFRAAGHGMPTAEAALAYDTAALVLDAVTRAAEPTPAALHDALSNARNVEGAAGVLSMGPDREVQTRVAVGTSSVPDGDPVWSARIGS